MKKLLLSIVLCMASLLSYSQEMPELQLLNFEGVSFDATKDVFAKNLTDKLGWEVVSMQENGFIIEGEYLNKPCLAVVEVSPKTKYAYLLHIKFMVEENESFMTFARAVTRLTSMYGEPDIDRVSDRNDLLIRVWEPPFKGYEILKEEKGIRCGIVMLQLDDDGLWLKMVDSTNKFLNDSERGLIKD